MQPFLSRRAFLAAFATLLFALLFPLLAGSGAWAQDDAMPAPVAAPAPTFPVGADTAWLLVSSALVMLMTPALALFYAGLVRRKNVLSTMMLCLVCLPVVSIVWVVCGYSLAFGAGSPFLGGLQHAFLRGTEPGAQLTINSEVVTAPARLFVVYQMMFAVITPALIAGAVVERIRFGAFAVFVALWSLLVYCPVAHMVWGDGGFLHKIGALDFAGGLAVHVASGVSALTLCLILGKRRLRPGEAALTPHNLPTMLTGAFLLWFGWFGFNAGSAGAASELASSALLNTHLAAAAGALAWAIVERITIKQATTVGFASGAVIGLVSITPGSGYVSPLSALLIGAIGAVAGYFATRLKAVLGADDTLDVFAIHGVGGLWGTVAVGLFADAAINPHGNGLLTGGGFGLLGAQLISVMVAVAVSVAGTAAIALGLRQVMGLRVSEAVEESGVDTAIHGEEAYAG